MNKKAYLELQIKQGRTFKPSYLEQEGTPLRKRANPSTDSTPKYPEFEDESFMNLTQTSDQLNQLIKRAQKIIKSSQGSQPKTQTIDSLVNIGDSTEEEQKEFVAQNPSCLNFSETPFQANCGVSEFDQNQGLYKVPLRLSKLAQWNYSKKY